MLRDRGLLVVLGSYVFGAGISLLAAAQFGGRTLQLLDPCLWIGLLVIVGLYVGRRRGLDWSRIWQLFWLVVGVVALVNLFLHLFQVQQYGDARYMRRIVAHSHGMARWLAGSALLSWLHAAIFQLPVIAKAALPPALTASYLVRIAGIAAMVGGSIALHRRWPNRLFIILPTLCPIWLLFSLGYLEYYPLVVCALIALLAWTFERPLGERQPEKVGALASCLFPLLYVGYAPVSFFLLFFYSLEKPSKAVRAVAAALIVAVVGIVIFWPEGVGSFFTNLYRSLNLGDKGTGFKAYRGHAAGPDSVFFTWSYALTGQHLRHLNLMWLFGGGIAVWLILLGAGVVLLWRNRTDLRMLLARKRFWLGVALLGWHGFYFLRMIPKLGPIRDIDLFFNVYVTVAFFAGLLLERVLPPEGERREAIILAILAFAFGCLAVSGGLLAIHGLRRT